VLRLFDLSQNAKEEGGSKREKERVWKRKRGIESRKKLTD